MAPTATNAFVFGIVAAASAIVVLKAGTMSSLHLQTGVARAPQISKPIFTSQVSQRIPQYTLDAVTTQSEANFDNAVEAVQPRTQVALQLSISAAAVTAFGLLLQWLRKPAAAELPLLPAVGMFTSTGRKSKSQLASEYVQELPGIVAPTGFFDPAGLSRMKTPEQIRYARESELKHGRVAMLAALGFPFAEEFHPIFPEDSVPSDFSFQLSPLQTYWPLVLLGVGALEYFSIQTFKELQDGTWELKEDHEPGNLGFDPLNLRPSDPVKALRMQNKELSNGRLAMIGIAGMVAEELVARTKVLEAGEQVAERDIQALEALVGVGKSVASVAML